MASVKFIYRPSSRGSDHKGSIVLRIIHRGRAKSQVFPYKVYPGEWDSRKGQVIPEGCSGSRKLYLKEVSRELERAGSRLSGIIDRLELPGEYSLEDIVSAYRHDTSLSGLQGFSEYLASGLESCGQERTARAYRTVVRGFTAFNGGKDLPLKRLDAALVKGFERALKHKGRSLNTISYYMRNLRAIYNKAVGQKRIAPAVENPFGNVFTGFKKTRKRALGQALLQHLYSMPFSDVLYGRICRHAPNAAESRLYLSWRLFFFCFHACGMSFVDMAYLRKENIRGEVIGYYRRKSGQYVEVKVTPVLRRLIDSFSEEVKHSPYVFPLIRNPLLSPRRQYESALRLQNRHLKRLSEHARLDCALTTHVARHSWATAAKEQNQPLWVISEGLGHSTERTTYTYLASFDRSVLDKANEAVFLAVSGYSPGAVP
jgi:integrase